MGVIIQRHARLLLKKTVYHPLTAVPDACTRRISLNTKGLKSLFTQKKKLINHLVGYYADFSDEINKLLSI